jgi:hypothetical protein
MARVRLTLCVVLAFLVSAHDPVGSSTTLAEAQPAIGADRCVRLEPRDRSMAGRSGDDLKLLEALNRCDLLHLARLDSLVVPCSSVVDLMQFSPFPQRADAATDIDRLLVVDEAWQAFGAYEQGRLVRWGPVSSGQERPRDAHRAVPPELALPGPEQHGQSTLVHAALLQLRQ